LNRRAVGAYARKGVLTLTQLAHTFRPRRRGKRADAPLRLRDHALHALAIRDQTIYVLGAPILPTAPVRIYLDVEGDPDEGFTYLIGLVVCDGERVERHSLWSDDRKGEAKIFAQFLAIVARYDAPRLYCYGNYERSFIARMRRQARRKKCIDAVLAALTNVLTVICGATTPMFSIFANPSARRIVTFAAIAAISPSLSTAAIGITAIFSPFFGLTGESKRNLI
jgi:predicted RecB family nuclease